MQSTTVILKKIIDLPTDWHLSGSVSTRILEGICRHVEAIGRIENSVETGSGKTTLLFSQVSKKHIVFALEGSNRSISAVKDSELFSSDNVTFVEGHTQKTLPRYDFPQKIDMVLIDGPHAYPFPDLEYFYLYPNLKKGGMLLIDDIHIPTIRRMFEIIRSDDMFELIEMIDDMAFFRRTESPTFNPFGDGWGHQGYNRECWKEMMRVEKKVRFLEKLVPKSVRDQIPNPMKRWILRLL